MFRPIKVILHNLLHLLLRITSHGQVAVTYLGYHLDHMAMNFPLHHSNHRHRSPGILQRRRHHSRSLQSNTSPSMELLPHRRIRHGRFKTSILGSNNPVYFSIRHRNPNCQVIFTQRSRFLRLNHFQGSCICHRNDRRQTRQRQRLHTTFRAFHAYHRMNMLRITFTIITNLCNQGHHGSSEATINLCNINQMGHVGIMVQITTPYRSHVTRINFTFNHTQRNSLRFNPLQDHLQTSSSRPITHTPMGQRVAINGKAMNHTNFIFQSKYLIITSHGATTSNITTSHPVYKAKLFHHVLSTTKRRSYRCRRTRSEFIYRNI